MKRTLMGSMLFISLLAYGSTHDTANIKKRIAGLRDLFSTQVTSPEEDLKNFGGETPSKTLKALNNAWNAKRNDVGSRVIAPLLNDLKAAGVKKDTLFLLEKKMIALFKQHFTAKDSEGGRQASDIVIYEYLVQSMPDTPREALDKELGFPTKKWAEVLDPKGRVVTYWQKFLVEKLEEDKSLIASRSVFSKLKNGYQKLYQILDATTESRTPGPQSIVAEFLDDPIWQQYEIEQKKAAFVLWAISNDGKLYYVDATTNLFESPSNLHGINVATKEPLTITNLPPHFIPIYDSCLIKSKSNELFKIDLESAQAISLNFTIPGNTSLINESYDGNTLLLRNEKTKQITIRNSKNELFPLPNEIAYAIPSPDGSIVLGFNASNDNDKVTLCWFNGFTGELLQEQEYKIFDDDHSLMRSTLSEDGSIFAFYGKGFSSQKKDEIIIRNSPISQNKKHLPKILLKIKRGFPIKLHGGGELLISTHRLYFVNSKVTIKYQEDSASVVSSQGQWIAFITDIKGKDIQVVHTWKVSFNAANQLKERFDDTGSQEPILTGQEKSNLLELYKNIAVVDMPEKWVKFAEKIAKSSKT